MVIASGITTSRINFSFGSSLACPFKRWVRRRNEAIERSRTSSALSAVTSVRRPRCFCGPRGAGFGASAGATACRAGCFFLFRLRRQRAGMRPLGFFFPAKAFFRDLVGFALGLFIVTPAVVLLALARFGGFTLGTIDALAAGAAAGLFLGLFALFGFANAEIGQRHGARVTLFLGKRAQHDAGRFGRRRG